MCLDIEIFLPEGILTFTYKNKFYILAVPKTQYWERWVMLRGKTDPNFPGKLLLYIASLLWPYSAFGCFFQAPCHLRTVIAISHAEMLMTKEKVTFSALRNQR